MAIDSRGKLPTPRLTATIYPPARRNDLGAVVVTLGGRKLEPEAAPRDRYTVTAGVRSAIRGHAPVERWDLEDQG